MDSTFSAKDFVSALAQDLVDSFDKAGNRHEDMKCWLAEWLTGIFV